MIREYWDRFIKAASKYWTRCVRWIRHLWDKYVRKIEIEPEILIYKDIDPGMPTDLGQIINIGE